MFTGIVQCLGRVRAYRPTDAEDGRLEIGWQVPPGGRQPEPGDSIAVNGACLTAVQVEATGFAADVSAETLGCTTLGELQPGSAVNLEAARCVGDPLGGHLLSGHVDGVAEVIERRPEGRSLCFLLRPPPALLRYIAAKGSVAVDGVSLTVNSVDAAEFSVNIIPHTLEQTLFGEYRSGSRVNLEVDLIARYLERLSTFRTADIT